MIYKKPEGTFGVMEIRMTLDEFHKKYGYNIEEIKKELFGKVRVINGRRYKLFSITTEFIKNESLITLVYELASLFNERFGVDAPNHINCKSVIQIIK